MILGTMLFAAGIVWSGIVPDNHLGGRMASPGYLQGKVILVDCRDYATGDKAERIRLEEFWQGYKGKPFVVVGAHMGGDVEKAKARIRADGITYPVYSNVSFESPLFNGESGYMYVINGAGQVAMRTRDMNRAYEVVITCIAWHIVPDTVAHYRKLIDFEKAILPGLAFNHLEAMRKAYPAEAKEYEPLLGEWAKDDVVARLAKLEETVRQIKDFDRNQRHNGKRIRISRTKVEAIIERATALKENADPNVVQEAKNCIAELKWILASL